MPDFSRNMHHLLSIGLLIRLPYSLSNSQDVCTCVEIIINRPGQSIHSFPICFFVTEESIVALLLFPFPISTKSWLWDDFTLRFENMSFLWRVFG